MTDVTQGNQNEARDPTGTMVDQTPKPDQKVTDTTGSPTPDPKLETKAEPDQSKKDDQSKSDVKSEKSLLGDDKKEEGKKEEKVVPEKYEFKLPEGVTLNEEQVKEVEGIFKELGVPQDSAQKLMDFHVKALQSALDEPMKAVQDNITAWRKEVAEDPKLGPRLGEIKQNYSRMLDSLGDPTLKQAVMEMGDFTGVHNHPAFIRMVDKLAAHFSEGKPLAGGKPAPVNEPGRATGPGPGAMYPNLKQS